MTILVAFLAVAYTELPNVVARGLVPPSRVERGHAIVVLGGGLAAPGVLSGASLERTVHAVFLYRQGFAPLVIFSGGDAGQGGTESSTMASVATALGLPEAVIWLETRSVDTWTEAREVAMLAYPAGVRRILLVTDPFHMRRARAAFQRAAFEVLPAAVGAAAVEAQKPEAKLNLMRLVAQELVGELYYRFRGVP